eukprot:m.215786 g.215786  ORF g.215786 m.215786 type:complete len:54 (+) comp16978_c0_seq21:1344-1505(+)
MTRTTGNQTNSKEPKSKDTADRQPTLPSLCPKAKMACLHQKMQLYLDGCPECL